ncbi:tyrosine-protein phosphatase [Chondrinema litorale]|uniref:tyrosine-protein phosphatase n=1 Tax=Chondrinema litorale TaxID=2994555 RepID=UPI002543E337|nr:tyrosine-protein phosphatase [Chondrinema litorale]UZR96086.1 tyrosine-protein phosphatase [Chondrinema litorale]
MGLDYTDGCVNFRDFGAYINLILDEQKLPEGKFYRGGSIDYVKEHKEIAQVHTIINLRNRADYTEFDADYFHFPMENKVEKYDTTQKEVRVWLNNVIKTFENPTLRYPVLIHCLSGKDRTGIVVAALLLIMGISKEVVEEEYLLSEGEVQSSLIQQAISGIEDLDTYFNRVDLAKVKGNLLG